MNRVSHTLMTRIARCRCRTTAADASGRCRLQPGRESAPCAGGRADGRHQQGGRLRAHLHRRVRAAGREVRAQGPPNLLPLCDDQNVGHEHKVEIAPTPQCLDHHCYYAFMHLVPTPRLAELRSAKGAASTRQHQYSCGVLASILPWYAYPEGEANP